MSSFYHSARKVRDPSRTPWRRLSSLRGCVSSFCWLTGAPYRDTLARLGLTWSTFEPRDPPTDDFLRQTLDRLEKARNAHHHALRAWETKRVRAKLAHHRHLSNPERAALAAIRDRTLKTLFAEPS